MAKCNYIVIIPWMFSLGKCRGKVCWKNRFTFVFMLEVNYVHALRIAWNSDLNSNSQKIYCFAIFSCFDATRFVVQHYGTFMKQ